MAITLLPTPPSRQDPANFNVRADEFLGALPTFGTEANSLATDVNNKQVTASNAAATATNAANTATTKAGEALASANAAASSASSANTARLAAEAVYDSFDDRYLGQKPANPATDNDGGALLVGALYFRTTAPIGMKVWTGTAWDDAYANLGSKFDKAGGTISGGISVAGNILATSGVLGYGVGNGGTASQPGQNSGNQAKNLDVVLHKPTGVITMGNASLGASAVTVFLLQSSFITTSSTVSVTVINASVTSAYNYRLEVLSSITGGVLIHLSNVSGGALAEALQFQFNVHAGSQS